MNGVVKLRCLIQVNMFSKKINKFSKKINKILLGFAFFIVFIIIAFRDNMTERVKCNKKVERVENRQYLTKKSVNIFDKSMNTKNSIVERSGNEVYIVLPTFKEVTDDECKALMKPFNIKHIDELVEVLDYYDKDLSEISILDNGCNPKGGQACYLSNRGPSVTCLNIFSAGFPKSIKLQCPRVQSIALSGPGPLPFWEKTFDVVISLAVLEHVYDLDSYINESMRVMKKGGIGYFRWGPMFYSTHGHHSGWISSNFLNGKNIKDVVGDWNHLLMDKNELITHIKPQLSFNKINEAKLDQQLEHLMYYIYEKNDLNRLHWENYISVFNKLQDDGDIEILKMCQINLNLINLNLSPKKISQLKERHPNVRSFHKPYCTIITRKI